MPWRDRTGPMGQGPMTGRGMGPCESGFRGRGFGRGLRARQFMREPVPAYAPVRYSKEDEGQMLKEEIEILKKEREALEQDLKEMEKRLQELK